MKTKTNLNVQYAIETTQKLSLNVVFLSSSDLINTQKDWKMMLVTRVIANTFF